VIKHYETTPAKDEMKQEQRTEMKEKVRLLKWLDDQVLIETARKDTGAVAGQGRRYQQRD
jgi:hypothetical protein